MSTAKIFSEFHAGETFYRKLASVIMAMVKAPTAGVACLQRDAPRSMQGYDVPLWKVPDDELMMTGDRVEDLRRQGRVFGSIPTTEENKVVAYCRRNDLKPDMVHLRDRRYWAWVSRAHVAYGISDFDPDVVERWLINQQDLAPLEQVVG